MTNVEIVYSAVLGGGVSIVHVHVYSCISTKLVCQQNSDQTNDNEENCDVPYSQLHPPVIVLYMVTTCWWSWLAWCRMGQATLPQYREIWCNVKEQRYMLESTPNSVKWCSLYKESLTNWYWSVKSKLGLVKVCLKALGKDLVSRKIYQLSTFFVYQVEQTLCLIICVWPFCESYVSVGFLKIVMNWVMDI